jgi:hypothetical protein
MSHAGCTPAYPVPRYLPPQAPCAVRRFKTLALSNYVVLHSLQGIKDQICRMRSHADTLRAVLCCITQVARDLEDPFLFEPNEIPLAHMQYNFNCTLLQMVHSVRPSSSVDRMLLVRK